MSKKVEKFAGNQTLGRTRPQYASFRRAFKKWSDDKRGRDDWTKAKITANSIQLVRSGAVLYEYIAPDYTHYMTYAWRKYT